MLCLTWPRLLLPGGDPTENKAHVQWRSQQGASDQPGVAQKSSLFQYKNVVEYKVLDYFSA